jgi:uncharacterized oxidoreductase
MKLNKRTVLITGGGTGIGLAIAIALSKQGNKVIICGRREDKLKAAKILDPSIEYYVSDLRKSEEINKLYEWIVNQFPDVSILINNAGIQRGRNFNITESLDDLSSEVDINFSSPVILSSLFINHLKSLKEAAIINVTSSLAFAPIAFLPVYCATKAAMHSFTISLRHQLKNTCIRVFELIPPIVDTDLDKGERMKRGQTDRGIPSSVVAEALISGVEADEFEILVGGAKYLREAGEKAFANINH